MDVPFQGGPLCNRPHGVAVNDNFIAFEIDEYGCGQLKSELPLNLTAAEINYIKSLVPRAESGMLELLDPNTGEVVFTCTPTLVL